MPNINDKNRKKAIGATVGKDGKKKIYTYGGQKIKARVGDKNSVNKKGETVITRKNGNKVVRKLTGRVVRTKKDGTKVISVPRGSGIPDRNRFPGNTRPIKGQKTGYQRGTTAVKTPR